MNLFLAEHLNENGGYLGKEESHHASRVLRVEAGQEILCTLGKGIIYRSLVEETSKQRVSFRNIEVFKEEKQDRHLHIAIAPTKSNDRFEFFLEKATEMGVQEITPIICRNSERKVYKTERGQKIISSAAKQSLSCHWPVLNEAVKLEQLETSSQDHKLIAHCQEGSKPNILRDLGNYQSLLMLIGPEGDFTASEVDWALKNGFAECSLGEKRLRTETAGISVALAFAMS